MFFNININNNALYTCLCHLLSKNNRGKNKVTIPLSHFINNPIDHSDKLIIKYFTQLKDKSISFILDLSNDNDSSYAFQKINVLEFFALYENEENKKKYITVIFDATFVRLVERLANEFNLHSNINPRLFGFLFCENLKELSNHCTNKNDENLINSLSELMSIKDQNISNFDFTSNETIHIDSNFLAPPLYLHNTILLENSVYYATNVVDEFNITSDSFNSNYVIQKLWYVQFIKTIFLSNIGNNSNIFYNRDHNNEVSNFTTKLIDEKDNTELKEKTRININTLFKNQIPNFQPVRKIDCELLDNDTYINHFISSLFSTN